MGIRARDTEFEFTAELRALAAAGTDQLLWRAPFPCQITAVEWAPDAAYTAAAPGNDTVLTIRKNNVAGAAGIVAGGASLTAGATAKGASIVLPLSTTLAQTQLDSPQDPTLTKDTLTFDTVLNGVAAATPTGTILIRFRALKRASNVK